MEFLINKIYSPIIFQFHRVHSCASDYEQDTKDDPPVIPYVKHDRISTQLSDHPMLVDGGQCSKIYALLVAEMFQ